MDSLIKDGSPAPPAARRRTWLRLTTAVWRGIGHTAEAHILFPAIGVLLLVVTWGTTLHLIFVERAAAEQAAAVSSRELAETYEAQIVRAVHGIDETLKLVRYAYELRGNSVLQEMRAQGLLPPALAFVVSIANSKGDIVLSTRASETANVAARDYFQLQRQGDALQVGRPPRGSGGPDGKLQFSRRLHAADSSFAGIVIVSVNIGYFVSGYEHSKLGTQGVLGIVGTDGVFRALRIGEAISGGNTFDYSAVVPATEEAQAKAILASNVWDGVRRYTVARQLYNFPLAVVVGLSADEQLLATRQNMHAYLWRASGASVLLILVVAVLGRLNHQLAASRRSEVREQVAHAQQVEYLAYHDGLTTLPNRSMFSRVLGQAINQALRYNRQLAVLFLDLDRFKHINDTLGHEAGDQLLQEVAVRLKGCLRESDIVARLGGDEFVALLPELDEERYAATVAQKILSAIARPFVLLGQEFRITTSIGISTCPQDGMDEQTLTKNADIAMYQAKGEGKNNFQFYCEALNDNSLERLTLESGLRRALERNEFELHYQAKRDIRSGRITGVEALLRWQHPDLGMVAPLKFIPVAEESGMIIPIGKWVLMTACLQNVDWQQQGLPPLSMSVNLTRRQFLDEQLLPDLALTLADTGMEAHLLELEIAESLLMSDVERALKILTRLRDIGVRIAIDDFGIGYSSLTTLKKFPLDTIKIDRSFIRDLASIGADKDLTEAIIAMGRSLSLTVVAQGVETKEQAEFLRQNACDEFQGFYLNKPLPADKVAALLWRQQEAADSTTTDWLALR